MALVMF